MPRGQEKKEAAVATKPQNPFAALADSDSEEEKKVSVSTPQSPPVGPVGAQRTWPSPSMDKNVFSSPFSKKRWNKPRFKEDTDGWVSIRWNQPQFQEEGPAPLTVHYQPRTPPFYSLGSDDPNRESKVAEDDSPLYSACTPPLMELDGPVVEQKQNVPQVVLEETITPSIGSEQLTALAWAERVKKSLEKAEAARAANAAKGKPADEDFKEALGRLSFFRRGISETQ
jgi:hypothetical protein